MRMHSILLFLAALLFGAQAHGYDVKVTPQDKVNWNAASTHATTDADTSATNEIQTLEQVLEQGATSTRDMAVRSITTTHNATVGGDATVTGALSAATVTAGGFAIVDDSFIVVERGETDAATLTNFSSAYAAAKSLTPGGSALSTTNRATIILPPGGINVGTTPVVLDANYIDIAAMSPAAGSIPSTSMYEWTRSGGKYYPTSSYSTPSTYFYGDMAGINGDANIAANSVLVQSANDVHLTGFGVLNNWTLVAPNGLSSLYAGNLSAYAGSAFCVTATNNTSSVYRDMWFWCNGAGLWETYWWRFSCCSSGAPLNGQWFNCISGGFGFRQEYAGSEMLAEMYDCIAGAFSFIGDYSYELTFNGRFIRCIATGHFESAYESDGGSIANPLPGFASFAGCRTFAGRIGANALLEDCIGGDRSCALRNTIAGTIRRCTFGQDSVAGGRPLDAKSKTYGTGFRVLSGILSTAVIEDTSAYGACFGGGRWNSFMAGTLRRCSATAMPMGFNLYGGIVEDCNISVSGSGYHAFAINRANASVIGSNIATTGTGAAFSDYTLPAGMKTRRTGSNTFTQIPDTDRVLFPSTKVAGDAFMFCVPGSSLLIPSHDNIFFDVETAAVWSTGASAVWEYSSGATTWTALTVLSDGTLATNGPFERDGTLAFTVPGDWAYTTYDNCVGYWIRCRITAENLITNPILATGDYAAFLKHADGISGTFAHNHGSIGLDYGVSNVLGKDTNVWASDARTADQRTYMLAADILAVAESAKLILAGVTPSTSEADLSGNANAATYAGSMTVSNQGIKGDVYSLKFDGLDDRLSIADNDVFTRDDSSGEGFSVCAWVQVNATTACQTIMSKYSAATGNEAREWTFQLDEGERLQAQIYDETENAYSYATGATALTDDEWYFLSATYDGRGGATAANGISLYVNGVSDSPTATNSASYVSMRNTESSVLIGARTGTAALDRFWTDKMGCVFYTPDILSAADIWRLYVNTRGYYGE
jgi:hypothetical protein